jgi:hypothetical protein
VEWSVCDESAWWYEHDQLQDFIQKNCATWRYGLRNMDEAQSGFRHRTEVPPDIFHVHPTVYQPALFMNASAASADPLLRHVIGQRARRSVPQRTGGGLAPFFLAPVPLPVWHRDLPVWHRDRHRRNPAEPVPAFATNRHEECGLILPPFETLLHDKSLTPEEEWHLMRVPRIVRPNTR